jgi:lysophospholipase L1-like esterase
MDQTNPPPRGAVLFVGSSSIRRWRTLAEDFPGIPVINRGFGGSQIQDSSTFAGRIIFPYRPRVVVLYAGDNDLAAGKIPEQVFAEYTNFVSLVHTHLPETRIVFVSIKPCPSRWLLKDKIIQANRQIAALPGEYLAFVDVYSAMLSAEAKPRAELFVADGVHLNEKGYRLWASLLRPYLAPKLLPQGKPH